MNDKQALNSHGNGACIRLKHHPLIPNHYRRGRPWVRGKKGYSLTVGRREKSILGFLLELFWKMSCWDDISPKMGKDELESPGACHKY